MIRVDLRRDDLPATFVLLRVGMMLNVIILRMISRKPSRELI